LAAIVTPTLRNCVFALVPRFSSGHGTSFEERHVGILPSSINPARNGRCCGRLWRDRLCQHRLGAVIVGETRASISVRRLRPESMR
jgi:hypothetical protein